MVSVDRPISDRSTDTAGPDREEPDGSPTGRSRHRPGDPRRRPVTPAGRRLRRAVDPQGRPARPACRCRRCTTTSGPRAGWCSPCSRPRTAAAWPARRRCTPRTTPLWRRYEQACDFLEDDLESGYVRVLQEMIAAGWSTPEIADGGAGDPRRLVRPAHRRRHRGGRALRWRSGRSRRPRWRRSSATPSSAPRRCCCSASTATSSRSGPACAGSAS